LITNLRVESHFKAVPYLLATQLMQRFPNGIEFATDKVNVIVGPNGAGKSALMHALSLLTLSDLTGVSAFDRNIFAGRNADKNWAKVDRWGNEFKYLDGLVCEHDFAPAVYYRPGHIPGNEPWINTSMMTGYFNEASQYRNATKDRSSGQQCQSLLEKITSVLKGDSTLSEYQRINWGYGATVKKPSYDAFEYDHKAYLLCQTYGAAKESAIPLVLTDEPEQSLDARAELELWKLLESTDLSRVQVIIATHSLYPVMHPERFNVIEAVDGYIDQVRSLMG